MLIADTISLTFLRPFPERWKTGSDAFLIVLSEGSDGQGRLIDQFEISDMKSLLSHGLEEGAEVHFVFEQTELAPYLESVGHDGING